MDRFPLDPAVPAQAHALERLETERLAWLGSNGRNGFPHAVPVWFLWHEGAILVFSQPGAAKTKNLRVDPRALFHFEAGADGEDFQLIQGTVEISDEDASQWVERVGEPYLAKYRAGIEGLGWTLDQMAADYSVVLILTPERLIGM
jgi:PPOX class probable F420-dependent enzyme